MGAQGREASRPGGRGGAPAGPEVTFAVVNGISNNRVLRMDLEETKQLVGYAPEDDAFDDWSQK